MAMEHITNSDYCWHLWCHFNCVSWRSKSYFLSFKVVESWGENMRTGNWPAWFISWIGRIFSECWWSNCGSWTSSDWSVQSCFNTSTGLCLGTLYFLALKGSRGLQCTTFIHNFYQRHQVLKSYLSYYRFENLFSTLSGVDEKIKVYSHVTLMIKCICIQRHPDYVSNPKIH